MHISVVIPARDEAPQIAAAVAQVHAALSAAGLSHDIVVVDDHSHDATGRIARSLQGRYPLLVVSNPGHAGKGAALQAGFRCARGDLVGFIDADLEFSPTALTTMARLLAPSGCPPQGLAVGVRTRDSRTNFERWTSAVAHRIIGRLLRIPVRDTQAGVKLFPGWFARDYLTRATQQGWLFDAEALTLAARMRLAIIEVPVSQTRRRARRAGLPALVSGLWQVLGIAWRYRNGSGSACRLAPLRRPGNGEGEAPAAEAAGSYPFIASRPHAWRAGTSGKRG